VFGWPTGGRRDSIAQAGHTLVKDRFDWSAVAVRFQEILERVTGPPPGTI